VVAKTSTNKSFGEIESVKAVSDLNAPVDGEVVAVNDTLSDDLPTINHDPYGKGWLIKVKLKGAAPAALLGADQYDKLVAESA